VETESCDAKTTRGVLPNQEDATRFQWGAYAVDGPPDGNSGLKPAKRPSAKRYPGVA